LEKLAPTEPPPPTFVKPLDYVRTTVGWLRDFGALPRPGGLDQQSAVWARDAMTYLRGQSYWLYQFRRRQAEEAKRHANGS
jgi:hypothetical protein